MFLLSLGFSSSSSFFFFLLLFSCSFSLSFRIFPLFLGFSSSCGSGFFLLLLFSCSFSFFLLSLCFCGSSSFFILFLLSCNFVFLSLSLLLLSFFSLSLFYRFLFLSLPFFFLLVLFSLFFQLFFFFLLFCLLSLLIRFKMSNHRVEIIELVSHVQIIRRFITICVHFDTWFLVGFTQVRRLCQGLCKSSSNISWVGACTILVVTWGSHYLPMLTIHPWRWSRSPTMSRFCQLWSSSRRNLWCFGWLRSFLTCSHTNHVFMLELVLIHLCLTASYLLRCSFNCNLIISQRIFHYFCISTRIYCMLCFWLLHLYTFQNAPINHLILCRSQLIQPILEFLLLSLELEYTIACFFRLALDVGVRHGRADL